MALTNRDIQVAREYHSRTKHSYQSVRANPHFLDWQNQPRLFKVYRDVPPLPLPEPRIDIGRPALSLLKSMPEGPPAEAPVTLQDLADVFFYSAGITRRRAYPGGTLNFRAAACTGALYSIELYAVCGDLEGLEAGIYLFSPEDSSLRLLRAGDYRGVLAEAAAGEESVSHAPVTIVSTGTYWRNAWKYQARTYRHFGWDCGTILANLLAVAASRNLPAWVVLGFADATVSRLLGLETEREVALNLVALGHSPGPVSPVEGDPPPLDLESLPYSRHEVDYPEMRAMHEASCLSSSQEVRRWRVPAADNSHAQQTAHIPFSPIPEADLPQDTLDRVILRRGSSRRFAREPITLAQLATTLSCTLRAIPTDYSHPSGTRLNDLYVVAHAVEGLAPGAYVLHRNPLSLELLKQGDFRKQTGYLGLEQDLPADCSAAVFFLAPLDPILERFGNRGYRALQLESGIIGGRLYLANYAQGLGATGLTFYDDEVTSFFSPHAHGKSAVFLVALGKTASRQKW